MAQTDHRSARSGSELCPQCGTPLARQSREEASREETTVQPRIARPAPAQPGSDQLIARRLAVCGLALLALAVVLLATGAWVAGAVLIAIELAALSLLAPALPRSLADSGRVAAGGPYGAMRGAGGGALGRSRVAADRAIGRARRTTGTARGRLRAAGERVRDAAHLAWVWATAWLRATRELLRARRQQQRLHSERRQRVAALGDAIVNGDYTRAASVKAETRQLGAEIEARDRQAADAIQLAREEIELERELVRRAHPLGEHAGANGH